MELKYERHGQVFSVDPESLKPETIAYLLQYGWAQSLQDSVAGRAKKVREESAAKEMDSAEIDQAIQDDELGTMQKRMDAILSGVVRNGTRGPRDVFGSMFAKVAKDLLSAYAKAKGKKLPKANSDELKVLLEKFTNANREAIETETKRRIEEANAVEVDADGIFD